MLPWYPYTLMLTAVYLLAVLSLLGYLRLNWLGTFIETSRQWWWSWRIGQKSSLPHKPPRI